MTAIHLLFGAIGLLSLLAAVWDLKTGEIPNWLVVVGFVVAFPLHVALHLLVPASGAQAASAVALDVLGSVLGGVLVCGLAPFLLWRLNAMGGGDVKLLAAIGALAGPMMGIEIEFYAFALTAIYAFARVAYKGELLRLLGSSIVLAVNPLLPVARRRSVPATLMTSLRFGPAVLGASVLVLGLRLVA